jgi:hypothetical protein
LDAGIVGIAIISHRKIPTSITPRFEKLIVMEDNQMNQTIPNIEKQCFEY